MKITAEWLRAQNACKEQTELFDRTFPSGAGLDDIDTARAAGLSLAWLAGNPSTPPAGLERLAADSDASVRYYAARNPSNRRNRP